MSTLLPLLLAWLAVEPMPETFVYPAGSATGNIFVRADLFESIMGDIDWENPELPLERFKALNLSTRNFENLSLNMQGSINSIKVGVAQFKAIGHPYDDPNTCFSTTYGSSHWQTYDSAHDRAQKANHIYQGKIVQIGRYYDISTMTGCLIVRVSVTQEWREKTKDVDSLYLVLHQGITRFKGLNFCNYAMGRNIEKPKLDTP